MCYIDQNKPTAKGQQFTGELWEWLFSGPGWLQNNSDKIIQIRCKHRDGKVDFLDMKPNDVLHAGEDAVLIQMIKVKPNQ